MRSLTAFLLLAAVGICCTACQSKEDFDPNYSTKVKLTPEEEAKSKELMAGQKAPGAVTPGQPIDTAPMKLPPGKGK